MPAPGLPATDHCQHQPGHNRSPDHLYALVCNGLKGYQTRKGGYPPGWGLGAGVFGRGGVSISMALSDHFTSGNGHPGNTKADHVPHGAGSAGASAVTGQLTGAVGTVGMKLPAVLAALIRVSSERWA